MVRASIADGWATFKRHAGLLVGIQVVVWTMFGIFEVVNFALTRPGELPFDPASLSVGPAAPIVDALARYAYGREQTVASWSWTIAQWLALSIPVGFGIVLLQLKLVRGEEPGGISTFLAPYRRYAPLLGTVVASTIITAGLIVLPISVVMLFGLGIVTSSSLAMEAVMMLDSFALAFFVVMVIVAVSLSPLLVVSIGIMHAPLLVLDRQLGAVDAVYASWAMMRGYKWRGLMLHIATAAIILLGVLALGIGLIVAMPVAGLASAAFYNRVLAANPPPQLPRELRPV